MSAIVKTRIALFVSLAGAAVLFFFPPERYHFYPQCPIFRYLHLYCPGCGATRALAALVHGRITEALHYNALVAVLAPILLAYFASAYWSARRDKVFAWPQVPASAAATLLVISTIFGVLRNFVGSPL